MPLEKMVYSAEDLVKFWRNVLKTKDCWEWLAGTTLGYGRLWMKENGKYRNEYTHRISYKLWDLYHRWRFKP